MIRMSLPAIHQLRKKKHVLAEIMTKSYHALLARPLDFLAVPVVAKADAADDILAIAEDMAEGEADSGPF
jgi:hypothetical protein